MLSRLAAIVLLAASLRGCPVYEYEHEFWLRTDGSGTVYVTGRPALWVAFKGLGSASHPESTATREAARQFFEKAGLRVNRVTITSRGGQPYLFVSADFDDVNRLAASGAFPDLELALRREGDRLRLLGTWRPPAASAALPAEHREGLLAVRFHLPSKVYEHENAADGVERGNILSWRAEVKAAAEGQRLEMGAIMDDRSILFSTVVLFGSAVMLALLILAGVFYLVARKGRLELEADAPGR
jgi:hypothetical protein